MKKCTYCGRENTDDVAQCLRCGTEFAAESQGSEISGPGASENPARTAAQKQMLYGALWCIGGLIVTMVTYASASNNPGGGTYFVAWGAILFGGLRFFRGLIGMGT